MEIYGTQATKGEMIDHCSGSSAKMEGQGVTSSPEKKAFYPRGISKQMAY